MSTICLDPMRFVEKEVLFNIDNMATVSALRKGDSGDSWATTLIRAARVVAAAIGCSLYANWTRRRSSVETRIADDLTHNLLTELSDDEVQAYVEFGQVTFPKPILMWMANPGPDRSLGHKCLQWLVANHPGLQIIRPRSLNIL